VGLILGTNKKMFRFVYRADSEETDLDFLYKLGNKNKRKLVHILFRLVERADKGHLGIDLMTGLRIGRRGMTR
jgi:hypothetical protein